MHFGLVNIRFWIATNQKLTNIRQFMHLGGV